MARNRKLIIERHAKNIERLTTLRKFAEGRDDYSDHDRREFDLAIRDTRREIIDQLSNDEVDALKAAGLDPEHAARIIKNEKPAPATEMRKAFGLNGLLDEVKRLEVQFAAENRAAIAARSYYVVDKGFAQPFVPGRSIEENGDTIRKWTPPTKQAKPVDLNARAVDAALRHREP